MSLRRVDRRLLPWQSPSNSRTRNVIHRRGAHLERPAEKFLIFRFLSAKRCHLAGIFAKTHGTIPSGTQRRNDNTPGPSRLVSRHCRPRLGSGPCPATSYELNNLPLFFFTIKGYNEDKRFNQMSFSFSSPLFCCRVPGARHRVFCCILGFLQAARQIGIWRLRRIDN